MSQTPKPIIDTNHTIAIIVFCHGSLKSPTTPHLDEAWNVSYEGDAPLCRDHAEVGVRIAAANPRSCLVMSGSHTAATSKLSEGASYIATAEYFEWWGHPAVKGRCLSAEGYDTRDNLIYGIASVTQFLAGAPEMLVLVSFGFKAARVRLISESCWRKPMVFIPGRDPTPGERYRQAVEGEERVFRECFLNPLMVGSPWKEKRAQRNVLHSPLPRFDAATDAYIDFLNGDGSGPMCPAPPNWRR
jgi:hypothetical protein